jgi:hypothetical protein
LLPIIRTFVERNLPEGALPNEFTAVAEYGVRCVAFSW